MMEMPAEKFLPIQSLDIHADTRLTFNLYVNLPLNQKMILYCRAGDQLEASKIGQFTQGHNSNLFIEKKDYREFVRYVAFHMKSFIGDEISETQRQQMSRTSRAILTSTFNQTSPLITRAMMDNLSDITGTIIEGVLDGSEGVGSRKMFHRLLALAEKGSDFQRHPVNVTSLATLIAFGIGYGSEKTLRDVAIAALLHDVGLSTLPKAVIALAHNLEGLSLEEKNLLRQHPEASVRLLEEKGIPLSEMSKLIIRQHHEDHNGRGYPLGLKGSEIQVLSQIVHVADEIDILVSEFYQSPGDLQFRMMDLFSQFAVRKVIEPRLLERIRRILI